MKQLLILTKFLSSFIMLPITSVEWTKVNENLNVSRIIH